MEMALDRTYRVFRWILDNIIGHSAAIIMLGAVLLAILEMIRRDIVGVTFDWGQDAVTYFTVGSIYLYFAVTQSRRSHLAVTAAL
ncbi:MAG: TRAP transporter small permease subunit, partial [Alphaproteobacteria bacterium]